MQNQLMTRARAIVIPAALLLIPAPPHTQPSATDPLIEKLGRYVAAYGEKASAFLGIETYTQSVSIGGAPPLRPRRLVAEFAILKSNAGWTGFRDVVEVDTTKVSDRTDRLMALLTGTSADGPSLARLNSESARYNVGPIATNLNLPTTALFFFEPANLPRFTFTRKGSKKIDGIETIELAYTETTQPTLVMTRAGQNVPLQGTLWLTEEGVVVRTRVQMKNFADTRTSSVQQAPEQRPAVNPNTPTGGREAINRSGTVNAIGLREIETSAEIDTTYSRHQELDVWLPAKMSEQYVGPIRMGARPPVQGTSNTKASYFGYKQFGTGAAIKIVR